MSHRRLPFVLFALCLMWMIAIVSGCQQQSLSPETTAQLDADTQSDWFFVVWDEPLLQESHVQLSRDDRDPTLRQSSSVWVTPLSLQANNASFVDINTRSVFVTSLTDEHIISWLDSPTDPSEKTKHQLPHLEIDIYDSEVRIPDAAGLADHIIARNTLVSTDGDDLILRAWPSTYDSNQIIIRDTLTQTYRLNNPSLWYAHEESFLLQPGQYSVISLSWWSALQDIKIRYGWHTIHHQWSNSRDGTSIDSKVLIPADTNIVIEPGSFDESARVYHVILEEGETVRDQAWWSRQADMVMQTIAQNYSLTVSDRTLLSPDDQQRMLRTTDDQRQGLFVVENSHAYLTIIHTDEPTVTWYQDSDYQPYRFRVESDILLDNALVVWAMQDVFGDEGVIVSDNQERYSYYIHGSLQPQPHTHYQWRPLIQDVFGRDIELVIDYDHKDINPRAIGQEIVSNNTISVLPPAGDFRDILVQYRNIQSFDLSVQACRISSTLQKNSYQWVWLENYLFVCDGDSVTQTAQPQDTGFVYRKTYRTAVDIPFEADAFRIFFTDAQGQEHHHYAVRAQHGIVVKVADTQLHTRAYDLTSGEPSDGDVTFHNLKGEFVWSASLNNGHGLVTLADDYTETWEQDHQILLARLGESFTLVHIYGRNSAYLELGNQSRYIRINSAININTLADNITQWWYLPDLTVYGYTDRGLYKAWDTVYFGGFVRNPLVFGDLDYLWDKTVTASLRYPQDKEPLSVTNLVLDEFGGFEGSFELEESDPLGHYIISYHVGDETSYSHNIRVEEYKKASFFVDTVSDGETISLTPRYFFGEDVDRYDAMVTVSLQQNDSCHWYCRWWDETGSYDNMILGRAQQAEAQTQHLLWQAGSTVLDISSLFADINRSVDQTFKVSAVIKDTLTNETQTIEKHIELPALTTLALQWYPYERLYNEEKDSYNLQWEIKGSADRYEYRIYHLSYDHSTIQGVDGSTYYIYNSPYVLQDTFSLSSTTIDETISLSHNGEYLIRVLAYDDNDTIIGENSKILHYYRHHRDGDMLGAIPNNHTLNVSITPDDYAVWDMIPLHIMPYQVWAQAIVTVERGQHILDHYRVTLDGNSIQIPVKTSYIPHVTISVTMIQWQESNTSERSEPRFFMWYAQTDISTSSQLIDIDVTTDKEVYQPGEEVTMTISTHQQWQPVDARVSLAVVDKALSQLYHIQKEPLPYFYHRVGTNISSYTNMKLLYQSLKAFANDGSKGGGWLQWGTMFHYIRDDLKDMAHRDASIITQGWEAEISFVAPDNLTTWLIDAIAITKDSKLWTHQEAFVVHKDIIVEAHTPSFISLWDTIDVPLRVITSDPIQSDWNNAANNKDSRNISWRAWLSNDRGDRVDLGSFDLQSNTPYTIPVSVPSSRFAFDTMTLTIEWDDGETHDGIALPLEIRKEWYIMRDDAVDIDQTWRLSLDTAVDALSRKQSVTLALLPHDMVDHLSSLSPSSHHHPYRLLEMIATRQTLWSLIDAWYELSVDDLDDNKTWTAYKEQNLAVWLGYDVDTLLWQLRLFQHYDGWFVLPLWSQEQRVSNAHLSLDVLSLLIQYDLAPQYPDMTQKLIAYLDTTLGEQYWESDMRDETQWFYYLSLKAQNRPLTKNQRQSLDDIAINDRSFLPLIRYAIAVTQQEDSKVIAQWRTVADVPEDVWSTSMSHHGAQALLLDALLRDQGATAQQRKDALLSLIAQHHQRWRGYYGSSLSLARSILAYTDKRPQPSQAVCDLTIGTTTQSGIVLSWYQWYTIHGQGYGDVSWSCDQDIIASTTLMTLPVDRQDINAQQSHISNMTWHIANDVDLGESTTLQASWTTTQWAQDLSVNIFVPATHLFVATQDLDSMIHDDRRWGRSLPFVINPQCYPDHYEIRYDRIVLTYHGLSSATCTISVPVIKQYDGQASVMPLKIYEETRGFVWGRMEVIEL